ncbi:MAG: putative Universal stress protein [Nitrospira sp.]|jgi:nucleotide-binding universal stress UspA family protein|nr:putative Universal stress protein [Nitrospira sp.]
MQPQDRTSTSPEIDIDMNEPLTPTTIQRIFHPTDFSEDSQVAFAHALKLALVHRAELTIMHVDPIVAPDGFEDFPRIRPTLARWGLLPESSSKGDVAQLGLGVKKIRALAADAKQAIIHHLTSSPSDLMVLATHQHDGLSRWLHSSVAEPVSREVRVTTLFVPSHVEGFVSYETGLTSLHRLLLPISSDPPSQPAIDAACALASQLSSPPVTLTLVHAGEEAAIQNLTLPQRAGWSWNQLFGKADPVEWILAAGAEFDVDMIVMATKGQDSVLDMLRGSTTERVLRGARCPLLAIPASLI